MQSLRRWVPGPARKDDWPSLRMDMAPKYDLSVADISGKDMAFCAEFAVHGGVAISENGFKAETELLRMQQAGLLNLVRDLAPPFAVVRVTLSVAVRGLLSGEQCTSNAPTPASQTTRTAGPARNAISDCGARRNGFEVARGMISAAIKAELFSCMIEQDDRPTAALTSRVMNRISQIQVPF